jgi:hypothetical protein
MVGEKLGLILTTNQFSTYHNCVLKAVSPFKLIAGLVFNVAMYALLLFVPAGTLHWWRAWLFLAVTVVVTGVAVFNISSGLFSERARGLIQKGQPLWDRIVVTLLIVSYVGQVVFIPLDVFRFHLMAKPGALISSFGLVLYVIGWWVLILAMKINPFAGRSRRVSRRCTPGCP